MTWTGVVAVVDNDDCYKSKGRQYLTEKVKQIIIANYKKGKFHKRQEKHAVCL
jgi:hypothetical protein